MDDRQLLEAAARAARYYVRGWIAGVLYVNVDAPAGHGDPHPWDAEHCDADTFRLACDMHIDLDWSHTGPMHADMQEVQAYPSGENPGAGTVTAAERHDGSIDGRRRAARRAITRCAAEIGKALAREKERQ